MSRNSSFLRLITTVALATATLNASAGESRMPANAPASYASECGSCHTAFPPASLSGAEWKQIMAKLDKHFGDNASLDGAVARELETFLIANGGKASGTVNGSTDQLPRLTRSQWFVRKHRELAASVWKDARIKSAANCAICHPRANEGRYSEHEIRMPAGMRWED